MLIPICFASNPFSASSPFKSVHSAQGIETKFSLAKHIYEGRNLVLKKLGMHSKDFWILL